MEHGLSHLEFLSCKITPGFLLGGNRHETWGSGMRWSYRLNVCTDKTNRIASRDVFPFLTYPRLAKCELPPWHHPAAIANCYLIIW